MSSLAAWRPSRPRRFSRHRGICLDAGSTEIGPAGDPDEIARIDISIPPDGKGLPRVSSGFAGAAVFAQKCAVCQAPIGRHAERRPVGRRDRFAWHADAAENGGVLLALCDDGVRLLRPRHADQQTASLQNDEVYAVTPTSFVRQHRPKDAVARAGSLPKCRCPPRPAS